MYINIYLSVVLLKSLLDSSVQRREVSLLLSNATTTNTRSVFQHFSGLEACYLVRSELHCSGRGGFYFLLLQSCILPSH